MFRVEPHGSVAVFRMDDGKVNAMGLGFLDAFPRAWHEAEGKAVVLAGNAKAFGAGLDLKAVTTLPAAELADFTRRFMDVFRMVLVHPRPVVAAVDRAAFAGGAVLALCADFRIATPGARMGVTEVPVGVRFPEPVRALVQARLPAHEHASAILRGAIRQGEELVQRGWADRIVPGPELLDASVQLATELAASSPFAYAHSKQQLNEPVLDSFARFDAAAWAKDLGHPDTRAALARTLDRLAKR